MDYKQYYDTAHAAGKLFESGDYDGALSHFLSLIESDISDVDKAAMCQNIARVCEKQGRIEEAFEWYDQGVALEQPHCRHLVAESRAGALATLGRLEKSRTAFEALLRSPSISEAERHRFTHNIAALDMQIRQRSQGA